MDATARYISHLSAIADAMRGMTKSGDATVAYSVLADALYWSDEIPELDDSESDDLLRFLLRYRTTLILNKPKSALEVFWKEGLRQFPEWIGFDVSRRTADLKLQGLYRTLKQRAMAEMMEGVDLHLDEAV